MYDYFELVRLPNVITAAADVLAGAFLVGGPSLPVSRVVVLCLASMLSYAGGAALNDVRDAARDARERPDRVIPSGRVSRARAAVVASVLPAAGLGMAASTGWAALIVAAALTGAIVAYDLFGKTAAVRAVSFGPVMMGLCRALNLALGMTVVGAFPKPGAYVALLVIGLYVAGVTSFAGREAHHDRAARLWPGLIAVVFACFMLGGLLLGSLTGRDAVGAVVVLALLIVWLGSAGLDAVRQPEAARIQRAVGRWVAALVWVDALIAWCGGGWPAALVIACLSIPVAILKSRIRMT